MFKLTLAFLLFETLVATAQGTDECCPDIHDSLADIKSDVEALQEQLRDLREKLEKEFNWSPSESGSCPKGFVYLPLSKSCYKIIYEAYTWESAANKCESLAPETHLAAIMSEAENDELKSYLRRQFATNKASTVCGSPGKYLWVSGHRVDESCEDPFVWKLDEDLSFDFTDWQSGEPNCDRGNEHCVQLESYWDYRWNDVACYSKSCALCEYKPA